MDTEAASDETISIPKAGRPRARRSAADAAHGLGSSRLAVEYRAAAALIPFAKNARTHSDAQVAQIAASIREFGWTNPILVDGENGIIAGHARSGVTTEHALTFHPDHPLGAGQ